MKPSDITEVLTSIIPLREPVFIWGAPGVGKSSCVKQAADSLKMQFRDIRVSMLDPVDLRGLPTVSKGKTSWCQPDFLPGSGAGVLLLDELPQASPAMQGALFQLLLDRKLGDYTLPPDWVVLAAGNRAEDRAGSGRISTALANRFATHLDMEVSVSDWSDWAVGAGIAPEVRAFINFRPSLLFVFDPSTNPRAFATPRSWHKASTIFQAVPQRLLHGVLSGCLGEGTTAEFVAFLQLYRQLPNIDDVLANPTTVALPKEPAVLYSLLGALTERVKANRSLVGAFAKLGTRLPNEFGMLALRDCLAIDRKLVADPAIGNWVADARKKGLFVAA